MDFRDYLNKLEDIAVEHEPQIGDIVAIEMGDTLVETFIEDITDDGVIIKVDETALQLMIEGKKQLNEMMRMGASTDASASGTKVMGEGTIKDRMTDTAEKETLEDFLKIYAHHPEDRDWMIEFYNTVRGIEKDDEKEVDEAKYQGREVPLGKPMAGDVAKSKVYVRGPKGNVVKVNFGDKNMRIKKNIPSRRKSFRARHNCDNPGPRWKARYWSCRAW